MSSTAKATPARTGEYGLVAKPIRSKTAIWVRRAATAGLLGLALRPAYRNQGGLRGVDALIFPFFTTDPLERSLATQTVLNLAAPFLIWTVEEYRANSRMKQWPVWKPCVLGATTQIFGISKVAPLYFMNFIQNLHHNTTSAIDPDAAVAILPATLLGHVLPGMLMSTLPLTATEVSRSPFTLQSIVCCAFSISPITVALLTKGISSGIKWFRRKFTSSSTTARGATPAEAEDSSFATTAVKTAYAAILTFQAFGHYSHLKRAWKPILETLKPFSYRDRLMFISMAMRDLNLDTILNSTGTLTYELSTYVFGFYTMWDLRVKGYVTTAEAILAAMVFSGSFFVVGGGACYTGLWFWRESILYRARHHRDSQPLGLA